MKLWKIIQFAYSMFYTYSPVDCPAPYALMHGLTYALYLLALFGFLNEILSAM